MIPKLKGKPRVCVQMWTVGDLRYKSTGVLMYLNWVLFSKYRVNQRASYGLFLLHCHAPPPNFTESVKYNHAIWV